MADAIRVHVVDYGRANLYMRYTDPVTGKQVTKSTGKNRRKEAVRVAAKWEADLQEGRYKAPSKVTWFEFRDRYEREVLSSLAKRTEGKVSAMFNAVEEYLNPQKLAALTADSISRLQARLRERGLAESTIKGHLSHLQSALNWSVRVGLLTEAPKIDMPRRARKSKVMKGRPITTEEFERMLDKVPAVVGDNPTRIHSWRHYMTGLWWGGLRLEESLNLYWDRDDRLQVDLTGQFPMLRIPAALEKGNRDRLLAIAPEFAEFLLSTPHDERVGRVFNPLPASLSGPPLRPHRVSQLGSRIGQAAGVKVSTDTTSGKVKYASLHDLRRSFGERWAPRVMPQTLMELMRHESIETSLKFYVGRNAQATAETLYAAVAGNTSGNRAADSSSAMQNGVTETLFHHAVTK